MKSVDRSDRKLSLRGEILRAGVFSKSNKTSGGPATTCHPGARGPSTANALGRGHSPENHPDSLPNNITNGGEAREDSRGQTFVAGRSFGEIAEGAEAQPTPPMNKADAWPPMGPPFGPRRNTVPMRKKSREPELPELPGKAESESRKKPRLRTTPSRSRGTRPTGTIPVPCVTRLQRKLARRGAVRGHNRLQKYPDRGQRCQAAVPCPSRSSLPAASRAQRGKSGAAPLARFPQP